jgi:Transmembrane secretion effector
MTTTTTRTPRGGYRAVLAVTEFRVMFAAHVISMLGDVVAAIALAVLVYQQTSSPLLSALTFALGFLPYLLGGTLLSSIADRFPARPALVCCNLASAALAALMAIPGMPVPVLLALLVPLGTVAPVFEGARAASLPDVLGDGDGYVLGRSLLRMVAQSAQVGGFAVGGVLLAAVTPRAALLGDAASFLVSAALLRLGTSWRPARVAAAGPMRGRSRIARDSLAGLGSVLGAPRLRPLLLLRWLPPAFAVAPEALAIPYAAGLGKGTVAVGLMLSAGPVGTIAGEVLAGVLLGRAWRDRLLVPLAAAAFLPLLGYAAAPALGPAIALLLLAGAGSAYTLGLDQRLLDAIPRPLLGRAMSVSSAGLMLTQGLGFAAAGAAAQALSVPAVITAAGIAGLTVVLALARALPRASSR